MPRIRLALLVAVYLLLDFANPMMPGALRFGIEDSVEARQADRVRGHDEAARLPASPAPARVEVAVRLGTPPRPPAPDGPRRAAFPARRAHPPASPSAAHPDDH